MPIVIHIFRVSDNNKTSLNKTELDAIIVTNNCKLVNKTERQPIDCSRPIGLHWAMANCPIQANS